MIQVTSMVESADRFTVVVRFLLQDFSGSGIRTITLYDNFSVEIPVGQPVGCITTYEFVTEPINRSRLPLHIEAADCAGELTSRETIGPIFYPGKKSGPGVPMPCSAVDCADDPDCSRAVGEVRFARNDVLILCTECNRLRSNAWERLWAGIGYLLLALLFAVLAFFAFFYFGAWGILPSAVVATATAAAVKAFQDEARLRGKAEQCERDLVDARSRFVETVARANEDCCPGCIFADVSMPC